MKRETKSVRLETRKRRKAMDAHFDVHQWQVDHIREGICQADAGEFASKAEIAAAFARRRK